MIHDVSERDPVEVLAEEFFDRQRRKERVTVEDYATRHPELAERIRNVFPALQLLEEFKPEVAGERRSPALLNRLGEFRVIRLLGRGGMGVVYEAVQETLDRRVALKVLPANLAHDPSFRTRFHREARMAAQLHHPNIVAVHGAGQTDGTHFLVMELIDGASLDGVLEGLSQHTSKQSKTIRRLAPAPGVTGPITLPTELTQLYQEDRNRYYRVIADVIAQCADALAYAHSHGVIHRDIKPGNILLARSAHNESQIEPKITDFGLAKAEGAGDLTRSGFVVGTPRYVAPERFNGADTPAGDVFALGATMFELLTMQHAFDAPTRERLIDVIHRSEPKRPRDLVADVPKDLETITHKSLVKSPQQRYTAAELAEDLRRWLEGRPIKARRVGPLEKLVAWSRRNPLIASLTAGLFLTLTTGLIVSLTLWRTADANRIDAENNYLKADREFHRAEANATEANRQKEETQQALGQALAALEKYFSKVSQEKLLNVPGLQPLRRDLLMSALDYYQGFSQQHQNDPRLRRETAKALLNAGRIQGILGTKEDSRPLLEKSYHAFTELVREFPNDPDVRKGMHAACENLAVIRYGTHQLPAARQLFLESSRHAALIGNVQGQYWSAWGLIRAAEVAKDQGLLQDAFADLPPARSLLEKLIQDNQLVEASQFALARADCAAAHTHRRQGSKEALQFAQSSVNRLEPLLNHHPDDFEYRRAMARSLSQLAMCEIPQKQLDSARSHFAQGRDILVKLFQENPTVHDFETGIGSSFRQEGEMERGARNYPRARDLLTESLEIYERNHRRDPDDGGVAKAYAEVLNELSLTYLRMGQVEPAFDIVTRAVEAYSFILERSPQNLLFRSTLAQCLSNRANLLNLRQDHGSAIEPAQLAIRHQTQVVTSNKQVPNNAPRFLIQHYIVLWTSLRSLERWSEHEAAMQAFLKHHDGKGNAYVRAARECCDCMTMFRPGIGPPTEMQLQQADRFAAKAMELLKQAIETDADSAKKEFDPGHFGALNKRSDFRELAERFKTSL